MKEYDKKSYNKLNLIDKRLCLFNCTSFEEMHELVDNEDDLKIVKKLEELSMDEKFIKSYDVEKVNQKLMNSMKQEGIEQGIEQEKYQIARNSLNQNLSIDTISTITGLSINQINSIKL